MKAWWLLIAGATLLPISPSAKGAVGQQIRAPVRSDDTIRPARTGNPPQSTQGGVLIETSSNLGTGIGAELLGDYKEAVRLLTLAIEDERREVFKLALAYRFRGLAYKNLGRRDQALRDFLEVIRLQPQLDLGYYDAGVIY